MDDRVSWHLEVAVKPGQLDAFRTLVNEMVESTRAETGALSFEWYIDDDGTVGHVYERYADSAATLTHLGAFGAKFAARFLAVVVPNRFTVFGRPTDEVKEALSGFRPTYPRPLGGFAR
jgi:quinol monooxygenase YgiN